MWISVETCVEGFISSQKTLRVLSYKKDCC